MCGKRLETTRECKRHAAGVCTVQGQQWGKREQKIAKTKENKTKQKQTKQINLNK